MSPLPASVTSDVRPKAFEHLCVGHDDGILPAVGLKLADVPDAEQHDHALPPTCRTVREIALVAMTVTIGPFEVLDHDARAVISEHDVCDVAPAIWPAVLTSWVTR